MDKEKICTILGELGGKGSLRAADALSGLMLQDITMDVPRVFMVDPMEIPEVLEFQGLQTVFIIQQISRGMDSDLILFFTLEEAEKLAKVLMDVMGIEDIDKLDVLDEVGNILLGNFVNPFSDYTGLTLKPTPPSHIVDYFDSVIFNYATKMMYQDVQATLFDASLRCGDTDIKGSILMFLDEELQSVILERMKSSHTNLDGSSIYVNSIQ
jgi:chemotaxis protein CheC